MYTVLFKDSIRKQSVAHIKDDIVWTAFKSKHPTGKTETVYNIEVADDNSYTVNNLIVHNCTYWSIAQKNNRETEASGLGWELFSQYVRALREAEPKYFLYENNKSMSKAIRESITETFGFEPICINSALVSAQNRQRLYWVGKREADGTYSKVHIEQPEDRGILLKDILETGCPMRDKSVCIDSNYYKGGNESNLKKQSGQRLMAAEPVNTNAISADNIFRNYGSKGKVITPNEKSQTVLAAMGAGGGNGVYTAEPVGTTEDGKAFCMTSNYAGAHMPHTIEKSVRSMCAEPVRVPEYGADEKSRPIVASYSHKGNGCGSLISEAFNDNKSKQKFDYISEPVNITADGKSQTIKAQYQNTAPSNILGYHSTYGATGVAEPICVNSKSGRNGIDGLQPSLQDRIYSVEGKHTACTTAFMPNIAEPVPTNTMKSNYLQYDINGKGNNSQDQRIYYPDSKAGTVEVNGGAKYKIVEPCVLACECEESIVVKEATKKGYTEILPGECVDMTQPNSKIRRGRNMSDKSNCCMTSCQYYQYCAKFIYATPCEWNEDGEPTKAISCADGKTYTVYKVADGQITIKGKTYPIKLVDGFYIIRKLTVRECARLQTIPEWYEFACSDSQSYKQIGNGWTIEVIAHLLRATKE